MPDANDEIRSILASVLKRCRRKSGKGQREISDEMSGRLGRPVKQWMFNEFLREDPDREYRFPAAWVRAFCEATGDDELAVHLLPEHLQHVLRIGLHVHEAAGSLDKARELIAEPQGGSRGKK
jgi:hypothetical protein